VQDEMVRTGKPFYEDEFVPARVINKFILNINTAPPTSGVLWVLLNFPLKPVFAVFTQQLGRYE
jgi:hypothetical protein